MKYSENISFFAGLLVVALLLPSTSADKTKDDEAKPRCWFGWEIFGCKNDIPTEKTSLKTFCEMVGKKSSLFYQDKNGKDFVLDQEQILAATKIENIINAEDKDVDKLLDELLKSLPIDKFYAFTDFLNDIIKNNIGVVRASDKMKIVLEDKASDKLNAFLLAHSKKDVLKRYEEEKKKKYDAAAKSAAAYAAKTKQNVYCILVNAGTGPEPVKIKMQDAMKSGTFDHAEGTKILQKWWNSNYEKYSGLTPEFKLVWW